MEAEDDAPTTCHWCEVEIREVDVLVGPKPSAARDDDPARVHRRWISVNPDPDGRVIQRGDGVFRTIRTGSTPVVDAYRMHDQRHCDPNWQDDAADEARESVSA